MTPGIFQGSPPHRDVKNQSKSKAEKATSPSSSCSELQESVAIYRWSSLNRFRFIPRFKFSIVVALLAPMVRWYDMGELLSTKAFMYGCVAYLGISTVIVASRYSTRVIEELRYRSSDDTVTISTFTSRGKRNEVEISADKVIEFMESQNHGSKGGVLQRLEVEDQDAVYFWSLQHGQVLDFDLLCKVLKIRDRSILT